MDEDEAPGVPEWVVTYGDMMSLLLTFFIMLVSMSEIVSNQKYRAVLDSLHQRLGYRFSPSVPPGTNFPLNEVYERIDRMKLGSFTDDADGFRGTMNAAIAGDESKVFTGPEGSGRRVGSVFQPTADGTLDDEQRLRLNEIARGLTGEPNKIEIRSWIDTAGIADPALIHGLRDRAYRRAVAIQDQLVADGVEPNRLRNVILSAPPDSTLLSEAVERDGAVTITVLDTFEADFVAGDQAGF